MNDSKHVSAFKDRHALPGEQVRAWANGYIGEMMGSGKNAQQNGVLIVTDQRVAFYRKGFFGEVLETVPLKNLTSIERRSTLGHRIIRLHTSHDALEFKTFDKEAEQAIASAIEGSRNGGGG